MVATIVTVIALSAATVARLNTRGTTRANDWAEAGALAFSATEHSIAKLNTNSNWRTTYQNNVEITPVSFGHGTISWKLVDEVDGNLSNDSTQSVRCYGIGRVGQTVRVYSVALDPSGTPLALLETAAHASGTFTVNSAVAITANGGRLSSNATLTNSGTITGSVEALAVVNSGTITGTTTSGASAKPLPVANVFNMYNAKATDIPWANFGGGTGAFQPGLLSASTNPYGPTNSTGVYHISVPSAGILTISQSRIQATLVIDANPGQDVIVSNAVLWEPPRPDFPILIVNGPSARVTLDGSSTPLNEPILNKNLNPAGTPYLGQSDTDLIDGYPTELRGLIHVLGTAPTITMGNSVKVKGTVVIGGTQNATAGQITVIGPKATLTADPNLYTYPPKGYTTMDKMVPLAGTWRWEAGL